MTCRNCLSALVVLCLSTFLGVGPAQATGIGHDEGNLSLPLSEVLGSDESFSAEGSLLSFRDFELTSSGDEIDLDLLRIEFDDRGFKLKGPLRARNGDVVDLTLDYVVESEENLITGATLGLKGLALGTGSGITVLETFEEFADADLEASIDHGLDRERERASFGDGALSIHVTKNILLETVMKDPGSNENGHGHGDGCGCFLCRQHRHRWAKLSLARAFVIEQRFKLDPHPIPEPSTAVLLGMAIVGLGVLRARSSR